MSSTEVYQLNLGPITAHAFNKDRTRWLNFNVFTPFFLELGQIFHIFFFYLTEVAICPNNNEVQIYTKAGKSWNLIHTLAEVCIQNLIYSKKLYWYSLIYIL
jgi:actin related protein 2/3 complex subunit 1A/1B